MTHLAQVGGEGDDLVPLVREPAELGRGVEAAGIGEHELLPLAIDLVGGSSTGSHDSIARSHRASRGQAPRAPVSVPKHLMEKPLVQRASHRGVPGIICSPRMRCLTNKQVGYLF